MISFAEFEIALKGLLRLVRFDAGFAGFFDLSRDGARRSFRLALPILPIYLLLMNFSSPWPAGIDMERVIAAELIGYVLSWTLFSLLLLWGAQAFHLGPRVFGAVTVYNWLAVLSAALQLPIAVAAHFGLDPMVDTVLSYGAVIFVTACEFFVFKRLLDVAFEAALALALTDLVLGWLIVRELVVPLALGVWA